MKQFGFVSRPHLDATGVSQKIVIACSTGDRGNHFVAAVDNKNTAQTIACWNKRALRNTTATSGNQGQGHATYFLVVDLLEHPKLSLQLPRFFEIRSSLKHVALLVCRG